MDSVRVLHIVGQPASGKTTLRTVLSEQLALPAYGIDDERIAILPPGKHWPDDDALAWANLGAKVGVGDCIVETSGVSGRALFPSSQVLTILCRADGYVRSQRLARRLANGYRLAHGKYVENLMRIEEPESFDLLWQGGPVSEMVSAVRAWMVA